MNNSDIIFGLFIVLGLAIFVMSILQYTFFSLAFYRFMKNRNLKRAFRAWDPFAAYYIIGKVCDDINDKHGKTTNFSTILDRLYFCFLLAIFIPVIPLPFKAFIILSLYSSLVYKELECYELILKEYAPNNSKYVVLTKIFMIIPIVPFIPSLYLLKASKNRPISAITC